MGEPMSGTVTTSARNAHPPTTPRQGSLRVRVSSSTGVPLTRSTSTSGMGRLIAAGLVVTSILSASSGAVSHISSGPSDATISWTVFRSTDVIHLLPGRRCWDRDERRPPVAYVAAGPPSAGPSPRPPGGPSGRPPAQFPNDKSPSPLRLGRWTASPGSSGGSSPAVQAPELGPT